MILALLWKSIPEGFILPRKWVKVTAGLLQLYILPRNLRNAIRTYKSFLIENGVMMKPAVQAMHSLLLLTPD